MRVASCASLERASSSFASLRVVAGDVVDECVTLARLDRGTLNALVAVEGSLVVRRTNLRAVSNLFSLARVGGDVRVAGNPAMSSLDGLQNVRSIGGAVDAQRLEGNFGQCGRVSERFGVRHACYDRNFRFCQPFIPPGFLHAVDGGVPGWYACVDSVATAIFAAPETRTTAAIVKAAGLVDAFQTPRARAHALRAHGHRVGTRDRAVRRFAGAGALRRRRRRRNNPSPTSSSRTSFAASRRSRRFATVISRTRSSRDSRSGFEPARGRRRATTSKSRDHRKTSKRSPRRRRNSPGAPRFRG